MHRQNSTDDTRGFSSLNFCIDRFPKDDPARLPPPSFDENADSVEGLVPQQQRLRIGPLAASKRAIWISFSPCSPPLLSSRLFPFSRTLISGGVSD